jgi:hypothetical protein
MVKLDNGYSNAGFTRFHGTRIGALEPLYAIQQNLNALHYLSLFDQFQLNPAVFYLDRIAARTSFVGCPGLAAGQVDSPVVQRAGYRGVVYDALRQ